MPKSTNTKTEGKSKDSSGKKSSKVVSRLNSDANDKTNCKRGFKICTNKSCKAMIHINLRVCSHCQTVCEQKNSTKSQKNDIPIIDLPQVNPSSQLQNIFNRNKKITKLELNNLKTAIKKKIFINSRYLKHTKTKHSLSDSYTSHLAKNLAHNKKQTINYWNQFISQNNLLMKVKIDNQDHLIKTGEILQNSEDSSKLKSQLFLNRSITSIDISNTYQTQTNNSDSQYSLCVITADINPKEEPTNDNSMGQPSSKQETQKVLGLEFFGRVGVRYSSDSFVLIGFISGIPNNKKTGQVDANEQISGSNCEITGNVKIPQVETKEQFSGLNSDNDKKGQVALNLAGYFQTECDIRKSKFNKFLKDRHIIAMLGYDGNVYIDEQPFGILSKKVKETQLENSKKDSSMSSIGQLQQNLDSLPISKLVEIKNKNEILSALDWLNFEDKLGLIVGNQLGTVSSYLILPDAITSPDQQQTYKICKLQCYNYLSNFYITNLSVLPCCSNFDSIFLASTADGMLKIFSLEKEDAIYEHQSLCKPIKETLWDISSNLILFSDENERHLITLLMFSDTQCTASTMLKKSIKIDSFVEKIISGQNNQKILFGTRSGQILGIDVTDARKYFHKNKSDVDIVNLISIGFENKMTTVFNTKHGKEVSGQGLASSSDGKGLIGGKRNKNDSGDVFGESGVELGKDSAVEGNEFVNRTCIRGLQMGMDQVNGNEYCVFGTVDGFIGLMIL